MQVFFFNDTATTEIYTLSLHDALPICLRLLELEFPVVHDLDHGGPGERRDFQDRKSTRLNSSHSQISYAVFCLKKNTKAPPIDALRMACATLQLDLQHTDDISAAADMQ